MISSMHSRKNPEKSLIQRPMSLSLRPEVGSHFELVETAERGCTGAGIMAVGVGSIGTTVSEVAITSATKTANVDGIVIATSIGASKMEDVRIMYVDR